MRASAIFSVREISAQDYELYDRLLPKTSLLLESLEFVPWERFELALQKYYSSSSEGQPEYPPIILLKLELLCHLYGIGRQMAVERATTDLHWKFFLGLPINAQLPDQSTLCVFRKRLGVDGFKEIFDELLASAREKNLVRDRLRFKDATHIYADIAVPTAMGLFSQLRQRLLKAVEKFDHAVAEGFHADAERMQRDTEGENGEAKLNGRIEIVKDIVAWIREQPRPEGTDVEQCRNVKCWEVMQNEADLADKVLFDAANPSHGDKLLSLVDPDARCGKHGEHYDGYMLDVLMDADSELVTAINVLPANGDEARDAITLINSEEAAHGNDIQQLSIDGIGFHGATLRELTDKDGLNVEVFTPPRDFNQNEGFAASEFETVESGERVRCPAGELSRKASRKANKPNNVFYDFSRAVCAACPLLAQCAPNFNPKGRTGRRVTKNEFEEEYAKAREKAKTPEYAEVRKQHPAIERKLNEFVRHHGARRARHRGQSRVLVQQLLTATVINMKRMFKLLEGQCAQISPNGAF